MDLQSLDENDFRSQRLIAHGSEARDATGLLVDFQQTAFAGFGFSPERAAKFLGARLLERPEVAGFVGCARGIPVSTALLCTGVRSHGLRGERRPSGALRARSAPPDREGDPMSANPVPGLRIRGGTVVDGTGVPTSADGEPGGANPGRGLRPPA